MPGRSRGRKGAPQQLARAARRWLWSAALLAGCGGIAEGTRGLEVVHEGEGQPYAIVRDDLYFYWANASGVRRAPVGGGAPVTLASAAAVRTLAPAGDYLYFLQGSADVRQGVGRVPREGGEVEWVADAVNPQALVAGSESVFWVEWGSDWNTGRLLRAALDGSAPEELAAGLVSPRFLALQGEQLYFQSGNADCSGGSSVECVQAAVVRVPASGGLPEPLASASMASAPVWSGGALYWLGGGQRFHPSDVLRLSPGGAVQPVADILMANMGAEGVSPTADSEAMFWAMGSGALRMSFATGELTRLAVGLENANSAALQGGWLYVAEGTRGTITKIAADGSAYRPTSEAIAGPCPTPLGDPADLARTPRAEPNLEQVALGLEPERVVVSQAMYERVASDVAAVRELEPTLAELEHFTASGGVLELELTEPAARAFTEGRYTAWDCLNRTYELVAFSLVGTTVRLELDGVYDVPRLVELYRQLPGVANGHPSYVADDGPKICAAREGGRHEYVFDDSGRCAGQCPRHLAYHFASDAAGEVTELAVWDSAADASIPDWYAAVCGFVPYVGND